MWYLLLKIKVSSNASRIRAFIFFCEHDSNETEGYAPCNELLTNSHAAKLPLSFLESSIDETLWKFAFQIGLSQRENETRLLVDQCEWNFMSSGKSVAEWVYVADVLLVGLPRNIQKSVVVGLRRAQWSYEKSYWFNFHWPSPHILGRWQLQFHAKILQVR